MKKHPIDEIFAQRLSQAEVTPRPEAWVKLQQKQQAEPKIIFWKKTTTWLVAAGISMLLIGGWIKWYKNEPSIPSVELAQSTKEITIKDTPAMPKTHDVVSSPSTITTLENIKPVSKAVPQIKVSTTTIAVVEKPTIEDKKDIAPPVEIPNQNTLAQKQVETLPTSSSTQLEQTIVLQLPDLAPSNTSIAQPISQNTHTTETVDTNLPMTPQKTSRFSKVWKQLKNVKSGEKIDWDEIGFNPNKLLAKATSKDQ